MKSTMEWTWNFITSKKGLGGRFVCVYKATNHAAYPRKFCLLVEMV